MVFVSVKSWGEIKTSVGISFLPIKQLFHIVIIKRLQLNLIWPNTWSCKCCPFIIYINGVLRLVRAIRNISSLITLIYLRVSRFTVMFVYLRGAVHLSIQGIKTKNGLAVPFALNDCFDCNGISKVLLSECRARKLLVYTTSTATITLYYRIYRNCLKR